MKDFKRIVKQLKELGINNINEMSFNSQIDLMKFYYKKHPNKMVIESKIAEVLNAIKEDNPIEGEPPNPESIYFRNVFSKQILTKEIEQEINEMFEKS